MTHFLRKSNVFAVIPIPHRNEFFIFTTSTFIRDSSFAPQVPIYPNIIPNLNGELHLINQFSTLFSFQLLNTNNAKNVPTDLNENKNDTYEKSGNASPTKYDVAPNKSSPVTNKELSKPIKSLSFIANGLTKIRDVDGFEEDFPLEEFDYFIESIPSHNSEGKFQDVAKIPSKLVSNARRAFFKSRPNATENELQEHLTYKFYGNKALFDEETSFILNQCLRTGSECFNNAKKFVIQNGYNIKRNEFF